MTEIQEKKTILVVDDEPDIQDILTSYLSRIDGINVINSLSGEEGVQCYQDLFGQNRTPVLVVMDLNLSGDNASSDTIEHHRKGSAGGMDGVRAAEEILRFDPQAIIWGYTAWAGTTWSARLTEAGAEKIVDRVVPFKEFAQMVEDYLTN
jgi:CheY-like chemotaxis protein